MPWLFVCLMPSFVGAQRRFLRNCHCAQGVNAQCDSIFQSQVSDYRNESRQFCIYNALRGQLDICDPNEQPDSNTITKQPQNTIKYFHNTITMGFQGTKGQIRTRVTKGTKHHCPGASGWVGDESPENCREGDLPGGGKYCKKHQMPCRNGCVGEAHLKNQAGCTACERKWRQEAKVERETKENMKVNEKDKAFQDFMNPPKGRKKEKK